jgi:alginate O-acetyltransferase complex protein AlgI
MLFTSTAFFLVYLPVVLLGYYLAARHSPLWGAGWLFIASLAFYGYWMPEFTALLLASILWNYWAGLKISSHDPTGSDPGRRRKAKAWLIVGVTVDLALLAYFKYAGFFVANLNVALGTSWSLGEIVLPIGISFFTFTQIAFLADAYQKGTKEYRFVHYGLFVTYFPHLIAGPVLHHAQMMPQFREAATYRLNVDNLATGFCIFAIGLFKKIVLADGISPYADAVFNAAHTGYQPDLLEAWIGALAYTFQLYFDFSGYSDMAVGLSWMFNVRLPYNFNSPYKALNITDFWRRWHMTLSAFLRDYLYIPLGGNRNGAMHRYINLLLTMILGGLWHGANWTFVFWGALHGLYLVVNHGFHALCGQHFGALRSSAAFKVFAWGLTFLATVFAWVFFRANDFASALNIVGAMLGPLQTAPAVQSALWNQGLDVGRGVCFILALLAVSVAMPNSNAIGERVAILVRRHVTWPFALLGGALTLCAFLVAINATRDSVSAFIYFNF